MISHVTTGRSLSRRSLLRAATAAGIAVATGFGPSSPITTRAARATNSMPSPVDGLASTPLGDQLSWLLAAVNAGGTGLTEADIATHVAPSFLSVVPPAQLIGLMQGLAGGYGALTFQGVTRPPTTNQAVGLVAASVGVQLALPITVEAAAPHRITGLRVYPSPSGDGTPLLPVPIGTETAMNAPLVGVGERGLYRADAGTEGPTVVFEAGLGDSDATWSGVIPTVAAFAKVVAYDRPNTIAGASDAAPMPRTADDAVADLRALLGTATESDPYVIVGHSTGGLFARLYASRYPDQVAGLVLVDASHEEQDVRRQALVSADLFAVEQRAISANAEGIDLNASFEQMRVARAATPLRPMPLVVISAGQNDPAFFPAGWPMEAEALLHDELQADLAGLVPGGRCIVAEHSGHYVQQSQPDLVVAAIRDVVQAVRDPGSWGRATS
jgi:pimeloyl-ACP methyl ester carboxylesterase